jgi:anti-anti-sigma factor
MIQPSLEAKAAARVKGTSVVLELAGEIDACNVEQVKGWIDGWIESGHTDLILNLERVAYLDMSGIRLFLKTMKRLAALEGRLSLVGCPHIVRRILTLTGLHRVLPVFEREEDALFIQRSGLLVA